MTEVRVASHVHSDWSYDGSWSLERIAAGFGQRGYAAVLLAEHDRGYDETRWQAYRAACAAASTSDVLLVPGIEYSDPTNSVHVPVWGDIAFLGEGIETSETLRRAQAEGGVAVLAHPGRRGVIDRIEPDWLGRLAGIEIWNRKYDGYAPNRDVADLLRGRPGLIAFASLDFHTSRQFHPLAMVMPLAEPSEAGICAIIREGRATATAFGIPALKLAGGPAWPAMCGLEHAREQVARPIRRVRRMLAARRGGDRQLTKIRP
jgi:predicted metal-dependent phosphoesterase TrpH